MSLPHFIDKLSLLPKPCSHYLQTNAAPTLPQRCPSAPIIDNLPLHHRRQTDTAVLTHRPCHQQTKDAPRLPYIINEPPLPKALNRCLMLHHRLHYQRIDAVPTIIIRMETNIWDINRNEENNDGYHMKGGVIILIFCLFYLSP